MTRAYLKIFLIKEQKRGGKESKNEKGYDLDHFITLFLSQNELNILLMDNNNKNEVINQDLNP